MFKVTKAQIEKAEVKANMTKERLEIAQELAMERDRGSNLEKTVRLLREQSDVYEVGRNILPWLHFTNFSILETNDRVSTRCWIKFKIVPTFQNPDRQAHHSDGHLGKRNSSMEGKVRSKLLKEFFFIFFNVLIL